MNYIVLTPNADGKFEFTKEELQKLLDDAYEQGKKYIMNNFVFDTLDYQWHNKWSNGGTITCEGVNK